MTLEDLKRLISQREHERVELKEWKNTPSFDGGEQFEKRKCILGYCVAIGNEGGGYLIIGVKDDGEVIGTGVRLPLGAAKKVYEKTRQKIEFEEIQDGEKRVVVIKIPSRRQGEVLKFGGIALMRVSDSLGGHIGDSLPKTI